jgi:hypothetical protein
VKDRDRTLLGSHEVLQSDLHEQYAEADQYVIIATSDHRIPGQALLQATTGYNLKGKEKC